MVRQEVVHRELVLAHQLVQVEAQRADVLRQFLAPSSKDQHAGLAELGRSADQEFNTQHRNHYVTASVSLNPVKGPKPASHPSFSFI